MTTNNTALKPAAPRAALTSTTCRVSDCGRTIFGDALVPALQFLTEEGKKPLASVRLEDWVCCRICADALRRQIPGTTFFSLARTRAMIESRLAAQAERAGTHAFKVGTLGEAFAQQRAAEKDLAAALEKKRQAHAATLAARNNAMTLAALGRAS